MFLFTIRAKPDPSNQTVDRDVGGAYVNVWVDSPEKDAAEAIARHYISDAGWFSEMTMEAIWVIENDYDENSEDREFFLEAQENGSCLVFNQWSKSTDDSDTDYETN